MSILVDKNGKVISSSTGVIVATANNLNKQADTSNEPKKTRSK